MDKLPDNVTAKKLELLEFSMLTALRSRKVNALLQTYGITYTEYQVLNFLCFNIEGTEPSKIADELCILRQTMTNVIDSLQEKGYVERAPHPNDRRKMLIKLLPEGIACITLANKFIHKLFASIIEKFTQDELDQYWSVHDRILYYFELEIRNLS